MLTGIRDDIRGGCAPRRQDLPSGVIAAIECLVKSDLVDRVGFYQFWNEKAMLTTYWARLAENGVTPDRGDCRVDRNSASSLFPGEENALDRHACFINAQGYANYRVTLAFRDWDSSRPLIYIGVLGNTDDTGALGAMPARTMADSIGSTDSTGARRATPIPSAIELLPVPGRPLTTINEGLSAGPTTSQSLRRKSPRCGLGVVRARLRSSRTRAD